jgi:uncharacterized protein YegL
MASAREQKKLDGVLLNRFDISICEAQYLLTLKDYDIVLVVDDSGSMRRPSVSQQGVGSQTRWEELKETLQVMIEVACCLDADGIDVHFLNMGTLRNVTSVKDESLQAAFAKGPQRGTPLTETVLRVAGEELPGNKPVIMVILTDGEPNGGARRFKQAVQWAIGEKNVRFHIMACTDNQKDIVWLNEFDRAFAAVDVTDDYHSERQEVLGAGRVQTFSRGDWIMKALLGPIDSRFDWADEKGSNNCGCFIC